MTPRATPLPPQERRAEIIRAALPLLLEHGGRYTTRQVAEAAGIAEGTLFRVFPTKRDLTQAVLAHVMDPAEMCAALDAIDADASLASRVRQALVLLQRGIDDVSAIFTALFTMPADDVREAVAKGHDPNARATNEQRAALLHDSLVRVFAPDAGRLACTPDEAASLLRGLAFATNHPHFSDGRLTDPARLAILVLDGVVAHPTSTAPHSTGTQE